MKHSAVAAACLVIALAPGLRAQEAANPADNLFNSIQWQEGPTQASLGTESQVDVPEGCSFTGKDGARTFMVATENPPTGQELGVLLCPGSDPEMGPWFVVFTYDPSGYVRDDEGASLDADAILASIREGNEAGNRERASRGWSPINIAGWLRAPYYDSQTHNLTWSTRVTSDNGESVNHSVRLLGRGGVMHADLVADPGQMAEAEPQFDGIIGTHAFVVGRRYAEWREGDKLAGYGLTALVAGGAGAVAAKTGLLAKFWKLIVVAVAGAAAWVKSLFTGKKSGGEQQSAE